MQRDARCGPRTRRATSGSSTTRACRAFALHLRDPRRRRGARRAARPRLERAIGVVYRPETELASHYFSASLPLQFDEYIWFDETRAVHPLEGAEPTRAAELPDTYPFGL